MKKPLLTLALLSTLTGSSFAQSSGAAYQNADYTPKKAAIKYLPELETLVFEFRVAGSASKTQPKPANATSNSTL